MDILTSDHVLHYILADSGLKDNFELCVCGQMFGGWIGSAMVDFIVSALWSRLSRRRIEWSSRRSARLGSAHSRQRCVEPWFAVVEKVRKMITKWSAKSWGKYSSLHVKMERVAAYLHVLPNRDSTGYSCRMQGFLTFAKFAVSLSNVVCSFTGIYSGEWQLKSHVW